MAMAICKKMIKPAASKRGRRGVQMKNGTMISTKRQKATEKCLNHSGCLSAHQAKIVGNGCDQ